MKQRDTDIRPLKLSEEIVNALSHVIGLILSIVALVVLLLYSEQQHQIKIVISCCIYGLTLVFMYASSVLYHSSQTPLLKRRFKFLDHTSIYLLIAGTYTPFVLVDIGHKWGWFLFITVWLLAFCGILLKFFFLERLENLSTFIYLIMGWLIVVAIKPLFDDVPFRAIMWLFAGGIFYSFGLIFYFLDKHYRYFHLLWHLFVIIASFLQFMAVWLYIIRGPV